MRSGVAADTKDSDLMPRFWVYHLLVVGISFTVRTRWSSDLIVAARVDAILRNWGFLRMRDVGLRRENISFTYSCRNSHFNKKETL